MRVLFLGSEEPSSTSRHRADAFRRLGHEVRQLDPLRALAPRLRGNLGRLHYHTGYWLLREAVVAWIDGSLGVEPDTPYDFCWVDGGEMLGHAAVSRLKRRCKRVVLFNHDDPTGPRDWRRFITLRSAIPAYDLCAVVRQFNVDEFNALGARKVVRVFRSYDEVAHAPHPEGRSVPDAFRSEVCFIGANYKGENRDLFLAGLIDCGLNLAIWGDHWERSKIWGRIERHHRGGSLAGQDYVDAIRGAKVCLGFLAKQNRDEHTTRTMEIPYAGGLLCAERTSEHEHLYSDGVEAVFWRNLEECHSACTRLLSDNFMRDKIRESGMLRVRRNRSGNESLIFDILSEL
jgi:hypothetical protein